MSLYYKLHLGVSPIVATIILVLISIAAGILLWTWISNAMMPTSMSTIGIDRIRITGVRIENTNENIIIYVYIHNIGDAPAKIVQLATLDVDNNIIDASTRFLLCDINNLNSCSSTSHIPPGSIAIAKWSLGNNAELRNRYSFGLLYLVSVITSSGFEVRSTFVWDIKL